MAVKRDNSSWNKMLVSAELCYLNRSNEGGIYQITHKTKGRIYIGSTHRFKDRWQTHLRELRKGTHCNKFLQNDFKSSGEALFKFDVLEVIEDSKIRKAREQFFLDQMFSKKPHDAIYNSCKIVSVSGPKKPKEKTYRKDWYWFLSPDKIEYVVENLSEFCETYKLHRPSMSLIASGSLSGCKGWVASKVGDRSSIVINKTTGEEHQVFSASKFARTHNLQQSHISKMLSGKRQSCGDWSVKNRVVVPRPHKGKVYWLTSPLREKTKVNNLALFCQKHNLDQAHLHSVLNGTEIQHKGWIRFGSSHEDIAIAWNARYDKAAKTYHMLSPDGEQVTIHNMSKFCRENNLTKQCMLRVAKGKVRSHKGWKQN